MAKVEEGGQQYLLELSTGEMLTCAFRRGTCYTFCSCLEKMWTH